MLIFSQHNWLIVADARQLYVISSTTGSPMLTKKLERFATVIAAESRCASCTRSDVVVTWYRRETSFFYVGTEDGYLLQFELLVSPLSGEPSLLQCHESNEARTALRGVALYVLTQTLYNG
jgi:hypothetical protein